MDVPRDLEHSRRRARLREQCLLALARARVATLGELATDTGVRPYRILAILEGDGNEYAYDLSLIAQGAAAHTEMYGARAYAITVEGAREVRRITREKKGE